MWLSLSTSLPNTVPVKSVEYSLTILIISLLLFCSIRSVMPGKILLRVNRAMITDTRIIERAIVILTSTNQNRET